jgi:HNH endonuclease
MKRKKIKCKVRRCDRPSRTNGYCNSHYRFFRLYGNPLIRKCAPRGTGWIGAGRRYHSTANGKHLLEHRIVAERALGKRLPQHAVVHHVDENPLNNMPSNLVVCVNDKYHKLLHQRMAAMDACGHYDWKKCCYCREYDDPQNMKEEKDGRNRRWVHVECRKQAQRRKWKEKHPVPRWVVTIDEDIFRIREMALFGAIYKNIASVFGLSEGYVGQIVRREEWAHV